MPGVHPLPESLEPPITSSEAGATRRVGVEIELTDLDVPDIAEIVAAQFGGDVRTETDYLCRVDTDLGEFRIEADLALLQEIGKRRAEDSGGLLGAARDAVGTFAEAIAPYEIVAPPLPYPELPRLDDLVDALRDRGGQGTKAGVLQALGLQLNPEVPRTTAESIHRHLRAYAAVAPWLRMRRGIDLSRRATAFINPYPVEYVRHLLAQDVTPERSSLIDDYLRFNPTRNRSLDMLPLFSHLDRPRVEAAVDDPRIKSRPTFHYRLPDSRVGDPKWRVTDEWRHWLVVERVAANAALLETLAAAYLGVLLDGVSWSSDAKWAEQCEDLLREAGYGAP